MLRQPSLSVSNSQSHSASPSDRSTPREVGEGVLDSSSSESDGNDEGKTASDNHAIDESGFNLYTSPGPAAELATPFPKPLSTPSPSSRATSNQIRNGDVNKYKESRGDIEDEDELDTSPSPQSTSDTETDSMRSPSSRRAIALRSRSHSNSVKCMNRKSASRARKSRSRSSTVASFIAPSHRPKPLAHQDSHSSIKTVIAGETSFNYQPDDTDLDPAAHNKSSLHRLSRQKSIPISELKRNPATKGVSLKEYAKENDEKSCLTDRRIEIIRADDRRFIMTTLDALKEALEEFTEEVCNMPF